MVPGMQSPGKVLMVLLVGLYLVPVTGCILVPVRGPGMGRGGGGPVQCHPSQYWDGAQCRHKGNGHGARKHDG
jgi:hypothetical protein